MQDIDAQPSPSGDLAIQTVAMPADTNSAGDIFGGWLLGQMDIAGAITAKDRAGGRVATVAINSMVFLTPVAVGDVVSCFTDIKEVGRSSIRVCVEVWVNISVNPVKVTEGDFVFVAIDENGRTRSVA